MFEVWAKQLSKLLLGKVYLGGTAGATKGKWKWSHTMAHEGDIAGDDPSSPPTKKWMRCTTIVSPHHFIHPQGGIKPL